MPESRITIDGIEQYVPDGTTILEAAREKNIHIPTLCHLDGQIKKGVCRICVVEVEGMKTLVPACATLVRDGMKIHTDSGRVRKARRMNLELLLSRHPMDCQSCVRMENCLIEDLDPDICNACFFCDCVKDNDCELQKLVTEYAVNRMEFPWIRRTEKTDDSLDSIVRDPGKCIGCRRCVAACGEWQDMHVLGMAGRGSGLRVAAAFDAPLKDAHCVECGQCVRSCPVGAVFEKEDLHRLADAVAEKSTLISARIEPYFLAEYLRIAGLDPRIYGIGSLMAGLKRLGIHRIEENTKAEKEVEKAILREVREAAGELVISAVCPAALRFVRQEFPLLAPHLSAVRSPQQHYGGIYEEEYTVSLSACSARKAEAAASAGTGVKQVISTRELHRLFTRFGVDITRLSPCPEQGQMVYLPDRKTPGEKIETIKIGNVHIRSVTVRGLRAARQLLKEVAAGNAAYDYIMLQACPEGCISTRAWPV